MALKVEIDARSGFCGGVIRAIGSAEKWLDTHPGQKLYSLGEIVHNEAELERLRRRGLVTVDNISDLLPLAPAGQSGLAEPSGRTVLIRAHGEPPATYRTAAAAGIDLIDCTCPVVLALQAEIRRASVRLRENGGQLLIFGKVGHPEVLGLLGQIEVDNSGEACGTSAVVIESPAALEALIADGTIRSGVPAEIFSQTTKSPGEYALICETLRGALPGLVVHDTICSQVATRYGALEKFARRHDAIVFVSGTSSSNGRVLFDLCRRVNPRSFMVGSQDDIDPAWLREGDSVGVCGATSTPGWLLEDVASALENLAK